MFSRHAARRYFTRSDCLNFSIYFLLSRLKRSYPRIVSKHALLNPHLITPQEVRHLVAGDALAALGPVVKAGPLQLVRLDALLQERGPHLLGRALGLRDL